MGGADQSEEGQHDGDRDEEPGGALPEGVVGVLATGHGTEAEGEGRVAVFEAAPIGDGARARATGIREIDHLELDDVQIVEDASTHGPDGTGIEGAGDPVGGDRNGDASWRRYPRGIGSSTP